HLPSGDHCGFVTAEPPKPITSLLARAFVSPVSTVQRYSFLSLAVYRSCLESGDQASCPLVVSLLLSFLLFSPRSSETKISSRPVSSLTKAIHLPSGDQRG